MVNRGKDSWNKAMLVDPYGNPSRPNQKKGSSTEVNKKRNEDVTMSEKEMRKASTTNVEEKNTNEKLAPSNSRQTSTKVPEQLVTQEGKEPSERSRNKPAQSMTEKDMRNSSAMLQRNKIPTHAINQKRNPNSSQSGRNRKKTPLEAFDVKAFFEENLYDIIDLEENHSGVREFEDAIKKEE